MADLAAKGIGKDRKNQAQGFMFRGIDDIYNALAPIMAARHLVIIPHAVGAPVVTERTTAKGGSMYHVVAQYSYTAICTDDGSSVDVGPIYGEAMDSGDKAYNKTMAIAYKYMALQLFCIPVVGQDDPDAHSPGEEVQTFITEQQAADLTALATEVGADMAGFLKYLKVDALANLPTGKLKTAIAALEAKRKAAQ
jgi:hypothetical protein